MSIPHYVNENKSDMRGIKPGWYAMEDDGKLSSGPFSSREECLNRGTRQRRSTRSYDHGRSEKNPSLHRPALRAAPPDPTRNRP